jgi:hypothetical protein
MTDKENYGRAAHPAPPVVRVLTVRQPHAHLLIHGSPNAGHKDVENRSKPTKYRGTLLIQASAKVDQAAYAEYIAEGVELPTNSSPVRSSARSSSPAASAIHARDGQFPVTATG